MTDLDKILSSNVDRRTVLKTLGLVGAGLATGCATFGWDPATSPPEEFTIEKFDRWYRWNKLYNRRNPNLEWGHSQYEKPYLLRQLLLRQHNLIQNDFLQDL